MVKKVIVEPSKELEVPLEFSETTRILEMGAIKHGANSWLQPNVFKFGPRCCSIFRHLLKFSGLWRVMEKQEFMLTIDERILKKDINDVLKALFNSKFYEENYLDNESQESHVLHGAINFQMFYTLIKRNIIKAEK